MPPRKKATTDGSICDVCWPDGWPGNDVAATCRHGQWTRDDPEPAPEPPADEPPK